MGGQPSKGRHDMDKYITVSSHCGLCPVRIDVEPIFPNYDLGWNKYLGLRYSTLGLPSSVEERGIGSVKLGRVLLPLLNLSYIDLSHPERLPALVFYFGAAQPKESCRELEAEWQLSSILYEDHAVGRLHSHLPTLDLTLLDLALAAGVLAALGEINPKNLSGKVFVGSLGTHGGQRRVSERVALQISHDLPGFAIEDIVSLSLMRTGPLSQSRSKEVDLPMFLDPRKVNDPLGLQESDARKAATSSASDRETAVREVRLRR